MGKRKPLFTSDFVLHSLRHTMLTRIGESGVDAFTIMRIAGSAALPFRSGIFTPTVETVERAFEQLQLASARPENQPKRLPPATIPLHLRRRLP